MINENRKEAKHFNAEKLVLYLSERKILEHLLGPDFHIEIFKRSLNLFVFMANNSALSNEILSILWNLSDEKLQNNRKALNEFIIDLSKFLNQASLESLFQQIISIELEKMDILNIHLLKEIVKNLITKVLDDSKPLDNNSKISEYSANNNPYLQKIPDTKNLENYGLKFFWQILQDNSKLPTELIKSTLTIFGELFSEIPNFPRSEKEKYLEVCFENVRKLGSSVPQSLILSLHIFASIQSAGFYNREINLTDLILKYNKEYVFIDMIVTELEKYLNNFGSCYEKNRKNIENPAKFVIK
jgi:hypothetical protein